MAHESAAINTPTDARQPANVATAASSTAPTPSSAEPKPANALFCVMGMIGSLPVSPAAKLVLIAIANRTNSPSRPAYPSVETISADTGLHISAVRRGLRGLEQHAIIVTLQSKGRTSNRYAIVGYADPLLLFGRTAGAGNSDQPTQIARVDRAGNSDQPTQFSRQPSQFAPLTTINPKDDKQSSSSVPTSSPAGIAHRGAPEPKPGPGHRRQPEPDRAAPVTANPPPPPLAPPPPPAVVGLIGQERAAELIRQFPVDWVVAVAENVAARTDVRSAYGFMLRTLTNCQREGHTPNLPTPAGQPKTEADRERMYSPVHYGAAAPAVATIDADPAQDAPPASVPAVQASSQAAAPTAPVMATPTTGSVLDALGDLPNAKSVEAYLVEEFSAMDTGKLATLAAAAVAAGNTNPLTIARGVRSLSRWM